MKVLIADKFESSGLAGLELAGCEVFYHPELKDAALAEAIAITGAAILVVRSTPVTPAMLDAGRLSLIVRAGAGVNTIDVAAASERGIYVSNCPGRNAVAVAELAFGLLLALDRRIPDNVADLRRGQWNKKDYSVARGLKGATLGLLGLGNIGREMAVRAAAFEMHIVAWEHLFDGEDRPLTAHEMRRLGFEGREPYIELMPDPAAVAERCDVLSVHLALAKATRGLVSADVLNRLRPGAYFINTARGEIVDQAALERVIRERGIRAGLDVFADEPGGATGEFRDGIVGLPNVYGTHHIGASTMQAQEAIAAETVRIIRTYQETGKVPNVVNLCKRTPATHMLVVRHQDRPGVLAHVFEHLRSNDFNVQETENIIFDGAQAAIARINLDGAPTRALLDEIRDGNRHILDLHLVTLISHPVEGGG